MATNDDWRLQNSAQAIEFSRECIRIAVLINGGAAIALVALLPSSVALNKHYVFWSLIAYSAGAGAAFLACVGGYFAQSAFAQANANPLGKAGYWANRITLVTALVTLVSFAGFVVGVFLAAKGLMAPPPAPILDRILGPNLTAALRGLAP